MKKEYVKENEYLNTYKILVSKSNGNGAIRRGIKIGITDTFINIDTLENQ